MRAEANIDICRKGSVVLLILATCLWATVASPEDRIESSYERSMKAYRDGRYEEAIDSLSRLVSEYPDHQDISKWYYWLGIVYEDFVSKVVDEEMNRRFSEVSKLTDQQFLERYRGKRDDRSKIMEGALIHEVVYREVMGSTPTTGSS